MNPFNNYRNTNLKAAGQTAVNAPCALMGWNILNSGANDAYLKFYNKAAPASSDTPFLTLLVNADSTVVEDNWDEYCPIALGVRATALMADNDNTDPTDGTVEINLFYK